MTVFAKEKWNSHHHDISISYNPNVWRLIPEVYDGEGGALFGVIDLNDGASFGFDLTCPLSDEYYEYEFGEAEYFSRIFNADNSVKEINRFLATVSGVDFRCVAYLFNNPRYGKQQLVRGMYIGKSKVMGISMAWSFGPDLQAEVSVPPKFQLFLDNLILGAGSSA